MSQDIQPDNSLRKDVDRRIERCEAILRHQIGIDPRRLGPVLDLMRSVLETVPGAAVRSRTGTPAAGSVMARFRINTHTTWRVRQILRRWQADEGLAPAASVAALADLGSAA